MPSSNIAVDHANGLLLAEVSEAKRISPNYLRLTLSGDDLLNWRHLGYDQWFRMAIPVSSETRFDNLSDRFDIGGALKYFTLPKATRPVIRNYTVRSWNPEKCEMEVDFFFHGYEGVAGPWAANLPVGSKVGLIDQGHGFRPERGTSDVLLAGDASAMPAILGILRDLPADASGTAIIEFQDEADQQEISKPEGVELRWIAADRSDGQAALEELAKLPQPKPTVNAFFAGESKLATGGRRHLIKNFSIPKDQVTFCGYWRAA